MKTLLIFSFLIFSLQQKPVLYIIGDSTVRNDDKTGHRGWGSHIPDYLDTTRIMVSNQAMAGRSTRTFVKEGRWQRVLSAIRPGDYLIMQFGHNEGSRPDTSRGGYRGVLRGTGEDSVQLTWSDSTIETVHSYGWYLRKFVREAKAKGAEVYIASMIPRNDWKDGKVLRSSDSYGKWAKEVAEAEGVFFIDLNNLVAVKYEEMGAEKVKPFFPVDHTHTNIDGAKLNAEIVTAALKEIKPGKLTKYLTD